MKFKHQPVKFVVPDSHFQIIADNQLYLIQNQISQSFNCLKSVSNKLNQITFRPDTQFLHKFRTQSLIGLCGAKSNVPWTNLHRACDQIYLDTLVNLCRDHRASAETHRASAELWSSLYRAYDSPLSALRTAYAMPWRSLCAEQNRASVDVWLTSGQPLSTQITLCSTTPLWNKSDQALWKHICRVHLWLCGLNLYGSTYVTWLLI